MTDVAQKIVKAGQAKTENLPTNASISSNPTAMADKVLKEGAKALTSQAAKGDVDPKEAGLAMVSAAWSHSFPKVAACPSLDLTVVEGLDIDHL